MGLLLESSGSQAQLHPEWHFGVLENIFSPSMIGVQQYAGLSLVVLEGLLAAAKNRLISYNKVLDKNSQLVGILVCHEGSLSAFLYSPGRSWAMNS
jgi:hypothetical protein